jgi:hypothetical protein
VTVKDVPVTRDINDMPTKRFEVYTEFGDYYTYVDIPEIALDDGKPPSHIVVNGSTCEWGGPARSHYRLLMTGSYTQDDTQ